MYGQDSGVWTKGILMDEYGFRPERNRWIIGGLDSPMSPFDFVPQAHPADVDVAVAPEGEALGPILAAGAIDALFSANVPQCVLDGSPWVRRLFPDFEAVERDYHRRTGIFPMMHTIVIRRDSHPRPNRRCPSGLPRLRGGERGRRPAPPVWPACVRGPEHDAVDERPVRAQRGAVREDWWPYGLAANRPALDANLRYQFEQGLVDRRWSPDEIFLPGLSDT